MPKYIVEDVQPRWVTYRYEVEAPSVEGARRYVLWHYDDPESVLIGDVVQLDNRTTAKLADETQDLSG